MLGPIVLVVMLFVLPGVFIFYNKQRVKNKLMCFFLREDKSVKSQLCELRDDFVIYENRAYDVYPDRVRLYKFPASMPAFLQEIVPCALYDERFASPLNWNYLPDKTERSMEIRQALDENWLRKIVHEQASEGAIGGGFSFNWRKVLPIILIVGGIIGFIVLTRMGGGLFGG